MPRVLIVGAGLAGCTAAYRLARHGIDSTLVELAPHPGGLIRSAHLNGVLYEPHGSHVFHTEDEEVWELAASMTPFRPYRHRVDIVVEGKVLNWPPLLSDVDRLADGARIRADLEARRDRSADPSKRSRAANFEAWCVELMGPDLYALFVQPYTEKQWGRPARELPATFAPGRISVRFDGDPYLFRDAHQGWPAGRNGYTDLIDGLLNEERISLVTGRELTLADLDARAADAVVLTCPLDVFAGERLGALEWRGTAVCPVYLPHVDLAQGAMVVNYPGRAYPFIRVHETKHASGQRCDGTVLAFEFPGAPLRTYPVETERNVALNRAYQDLVRAALGPARTFFTGRLASYAYLDMDDVMRSALDCADDIAAAL
jgi:UDP-galactopyranose mutase